MPGGNADCSDIIFTKSRRDARLSAKISFGGSRIISTRRRCRPPPKCSSAAMIFNLSAKWTKRKKHRQGHQRSSASNAPKFLPTATLICFRIGASHFLWKMVRRIVGMLVEVGRGNMNYDSFQRLIKFPSNLPAKFTAPPSGLVSGKGFIQRRHAADRKKSDLFIDVNLSIRSENLLK